MFKKILGLSLIGLMVLGLVAVATQAVVTDTTSGADNGLIAGKLDLGISIDGSYSNSPRVPELYHVTNSGDQSTNKVVFDKVAPGQSGSFTWVLSNNGSVAGSLVIESTVSFADGPEATYPELFFDGTGGRPTNNGGSNGDLDQYMLVTLRRGIGTGQTAAEAAFSYILGVEGSPVAMSGLEAALDDAVGQSLAAAGGNNTLVYRLDWSLDNSEPYINIVQGDTAEIDITFYLNQ